MSETLSPSIYEVCINCCAAVSYSNSSFYPSCRVPAGNINTHVLCDSAIFPYIHPRDFARTSNLFVSPLSISTLRQHDITMHWTRAGQRGLISYLNRRSAPQSSSYLHSPLHPFYTIIGAVLLHA